MPYISISLRRLTVPHERLLKKVEALRIEGDTLQWITDFLDGRHQRVSVKGLVSDWAVVKSSVHRGSVLSSVLFMAFINDLLGAVLSMFAMYADDSKVHVQSTIVETKISYRRTLMHWLIGQILGSFVSTLRNVKYFLWGRTMNDIATK